MPAARRSPRSATSARSRSSSRRIGPRYKARAGGYTRVLKAGFRHGDNAPVAVIEFVDRDTEAKGADDRARHAAEARRRRPRRPRPDGGRTAAATASRGGRPVVFSQVRRASRDRPAMRFATASHSRRRDRCRCASLAVSASRSDVGRSSDGSMRPHAHPVRSRRRWLRLAAGPVNAPRSVDRQSHDLSRSRLASVEPACSLCYRRSRSAALLYISARPERRSNAGRRSRVRLHHGARVACGVGAGGAARPSARCRRAPPRSSFPSPRSSSASRRRWSTSTPRASSQQSVVAVLLRSVLPPLLRRSRSAGRRASASSARSAPASSSTRPASSSPTTTSSPMPTRSRWRSPTGASSTATIVLKDERTDLAVLQHRAARRAASRSSSSPIPTRLEVGDLVLAIGDPVRRRPDGDQRHRLGARPHARSASPTTSSSSRPTPRSIRAIPAARWST